MIYDLTRLFLTRIFFFCIITLDGGRFFLVQCRQEQRWMVIEYIDNVSENNFLFNSINFLIELLRDKLRINRQHKRKEDEKCQQSFDEEKNWRKKTEKVFIEINLSCWLNNSHNEEKKKSFIKINFAVSRTG